VRSATWTSDEPVSLASFWNCLMRSVLSIDMVGGVFVWVGAALGCFPWTSYAPISPCGSGNFRWPVREGRRPARSRR
jgi:hypothetical protein